MKLEKVWKMSTPAELEEETREYYRNLSEDERVDHLLQLLKESIPESERRLVRTYQFIKVPERAKEDVKPTNS